MLYPQLPFQLSKEATYLDGQIWALKADSLTSPLIVTVTVTVTVCNCNAHADTFNRPTEQFMCEGS